ncbi:MAG: hypothetical protein SGILL_007008, partial [Bacillariaceae sp.]
LKTVPSLNDALAEGEYVTHTGACGACSSLQDLAAMIETDSLTLEGNECYRESVWLTQLPKGAECYRNLGFTPACASVLIRYQNRINESKCGAFCAAFALGGGQDEPSCAVDGPCAECARGNNMINRRYETVSGRTDINSGLPSWSATSCSNIASPDVVNQKDVCVAAIELPTDAPVSPTPAPVAPTTAPVAPTAAPVNPTAAPVNPTAAPVNPTAAPVNPTAAPVNPTAAPVAPTAAPVSPTNAPINEDMEACLAYANIEISLSQRSGNTVVCDCSGAETGESVIPVCYSSPDRTEDQICFVQFQTCDTVNDCCNAGIRSCRGGLCRAASRSQLKGSLRIGRQRVRGRVEQQPTRGENRRRIRGDSDNNNAQDHPVES